MLAIVSERVEREPQVLRSADEHGALLLDTQQRVETDRVGRQQLVELDDRMRRLRARLEKRRHVRFTETARETHDYVRILSARFDPAQHSGRDTQEVIRRNIVD